MSPTGKRKAFGLAEEKLYIRGVTMDPLLAICALAVIL